MCRNFKKKLFHAVFVFTCLQDREGEFCGCAQQCDLLCQLPGQCCAALLYNEQHKVRKRNKCEEFGIKEQWDKRRKMGKGPVLVSGTSHANRSQTKRIEGGMVQVHTCFEGDFKARKRFLKKQKRLKKPII